MQQPENINQAVVETIEWAETESDQLLVYHFPLKRRDIRYGAKLHVADFQQCMFVESEKVISTFQPGIYTLTSSNMPGILNSARFDISKSFTPEIFFWKTKFFLDKEWFSPEKSALQVNSEDVNAKVFGTCDIKVSDPLCIISRFAKANRNVAIEEALTLVGKIIAPLFKETLQLHHHSVNLNSKEEQDEIVELIQDKANDQLLYYGFLISRLVIRLSS
jgi:membrane protease subunit (stomatin/prohibitin family)